MNNLYKIEQHSVHLWQVSLPELLPQLDTLVNLLNAEEMQRAQRFKFDIHRHRYIIARAILREILSLYLQIPADKIEFNKGLRGKPYLQTNPLNLQFNVSHSHDYAVYALAQHAEIGVDIEMMQDNYNEGVAERFFSADEYAQLTRLQLHSPERRAAFFQFWAGKEAVIKALGEGLYAPLKEFSLDLNKNPETVYLHHQNVAHQFHLETFAVHSDYQSAFAIAQPVQSVMRWQWLATGPQQK